MIIFFLIFSTSFPCPLFNIQSNGELNKTWSFLRVECLLNDLYPHFLTIFLALCIDFVISKWEFITIFILILSVHLPKTFYT